jgi:antiviral helicase SLH1
LRKAYIKISVNVGAATHEHKHFPPTMSSSADVAQAQWLEQLAAMRKAIAELNLPAGATKGPAYGDDLDLDDDDLSGAASGEDIWDFVSDEQEESYSSDHLEEHIDGFPGKSGQYDQQWLAAMCADVSQRGSGLDAGALQEQLSAILASDSNGTFLTLHI